MKRDLENSVGELTRLAELGQIFARHGLKNLGSLLGIMPVSEKEPDTEDLRPASVVALLRDVGPVGIKASSSRPEAICLHNPGFPRSALSTTRWNRCRSIRSNR